MRRVMLVLAAILALVPASGLALCVTESGHVALELVGTSCGEPGTEADCMTACRDCEDTPLSVAAAHRAPVQDIPGAIDVPVFLPPAQESALVLPSFVRAHRSLSTSRTPLLRC